MIKNEIYNSTELYKTIVEKVTDDWKEVTYFGIAKYPDKSDPNSIWFRWQSDFGSSIWRIRRCIYDTNTWVLNYSFPEWNVWFDFKWTDRASLSYDWWTPVSKYIILENWDYIITELWDHLIIW